MGRARWRIVLLTACALAVTGLAANGQPPAKPKRVPWEIEPSAETKRKVAELIEEVREAEITMTVSPNKSKLIRTKRPVLRFSITDPSVMEVVQYSPTEFEVIGRRGGATTFTIWYASAGDGKETAAKDAAEAGQGLSSRIRVKRPLFRR